MTLDAEFQAGNLSAEASADGRGGARLPFTDSSTSTPLSHSEIPTPHRACSVRDKANEEQ